MFLNGVDLLLRLLINGATARSRGGRSDSDDAVEDVPTRSCVLGRELLGDNGPLGKPAVIDIDQARRHLYVCGATGTGKSSLLLVLVDYLIRLNHSFVVVDLRGDLVDRVLLRLAACGGPEVWAERLLNIDLRDNQPIPFNPLSGFGDVHSRAFACLDAIKERSEGWGVQLEDTMKASLLVLACSRHTLLELEALLLNGAFRRECLEMVGDMYVRSFFERYERLSPEQQITWTLPVLNKIAPLVSVPQLRRMVGQRSSVPFRQLLDRPGQVILISLAVDRLHGGARLAGSLLTSAIVQAVMTRVDIPEPARNPVLMIVDEFENVVDKLFAEVIQEGRRFGLGAVLSHQNLSQLPREMSDLVLNNCRFHFYFQTGARDAAELSREVGPDHAKSVRAALTRLPAGQAFHFERGGEPRRLRIVESKDPSVAPDKVKVIREASARMYTRDAEAVDRELEERAAAIAKSAERSPTRETMPAPRSNRAKDGNEQGASYEIRFRPQKRKFAAWDAGDE